MNEIPRDTPLRILLVEDTEENRTDCLHMLRKHYSRLNIDEAEDSKTGDALLARASESRRPYDCAILDLKIPHKRGEAAKAQTDLPERIATEIDLAERLAEKFGRAGLVRTRILQWTAYPEQPAIRNFQESRLHKVMGVIYEVLSKRDIKWPAKMRDFIDRAIVEKVVGEALDDPYFQPPPGGVIVLSRGQRSPVSLTALVACLVSWWPKLTPWRQDQALRSLHQTKWEIVRDGEGVRITNPEVAQAIEEAEADRKYLAETT